MVHFAKHLNFQSIDFLYFLHRKSVEKMIHQKKNRGDRTSKIVKFRQSCSSGYLPYHLYILLLSARAVHDVACEFACAVRMRRNN